MRCRLSDEKTRDVTEEHAERLIEQLTSIVRPDAQNNAPLLWNRSYPKVAQAIFDAAAFFHHPAHEDEWDDPEIDEKFESVWRLIGTGLIGPSGLLEES